MHLTGDLHAGSFRSGREPLEDRGADEALDAEHRKPELLGGHDLPFHVGNSLVIRHGALRVAAHVAIAPEAAGDQSVVVEQLAEMPRKTVAHIREFPDALESDDLHGRTQVQLGDLLQSPPRAYTASATTRW